MAMTFTRKRKIQVPRLNLYNDYIDYIPKYLYLGVILDQRLNWNEQCQTWSGKASSALSVLRPLFRSSLHLTTQLLVCKAYIRALMTYASPAWAFISNNI